MAREEWVGRTKEKEDDDDLRDCRERSEFGL
jgi:hypothetical protein